jgi:hypothetical protein
MLGLDMPTSIDAVVASFFGLLYASGHPTMLAKKAKQFDKLREHAYRILAPLYQDAEFVEILSKKAE